MKRDWNPDEPEMMDRPQPVTPELERDLENLHGLNRHFGSHSLVRHFLQRWLKSGATYRVLDLCTGYGDIPRMMLDWARDHGVCLTVDAVDFHPATLEIARRRSAAYPQIRFFQADARDFAAPADGSYDLVHCSLALHHFGEEDAVRILARCRALLREHGHVLVADLERSGLTTAAVWLVTALVYRDAMTRYDGRLSARRAFSFGELRSLAERAGWPESGEFGHRRFLPCRQALWV